MNGELAQIVALTCYGNAFLGGRDAPKFFPQNSTCKFCDSVKFVHLKKPFLGFGKVKEILRASTPDEWIADLRKRGATSLRLARAAQNNPQISDRMSAGFVGGGGTWSVEVLRSDGRSEFWAARWRVWNKDEPKRRIWRVTYGLVREDRTALYRGRSLSDVKRDLKLSLEMIHAFSEREKCGEGFTKRFADALKALDDPAVDVGYHKDLALPEQLTPEATSILKASMSAWVFGGMGSWNDMGFDGATEKEYKKVSDGLFNIVNEAIEVAATSSSGR